MTNAVQRMFGRSEEKGDFVLSGVFSYENLLTAVKASFALFLQAFDNVPVKAIGFQFVLRMICCGSE